MLQLDKPAAFPLQCELATCCHDSRRRCHWLCSEADFEQIEKHTEHCAGSNISSPALIDQMCNAGRGRRRGDIVISRWTIESGPGISTISAELVDTGTILKIEPRGSFAKLPLPPPSSNPPQQKTMWSPSQHSNYLRTGSPTQISNRFKQNETHF